MKPLLPTLKEKKRYVGFEVLANNIPNKSQIKEALNEGIHKFLGELGIAKSGFSVISLSKNRGILKVATKHVNNVKAAMVFIQFIGKQHVVLRSIATSGTLNKLKKKVYGEAS